MRTLHVGCEFDYDVAVDTPAVVIVQPSLDAGATLLSEQWQLAPDVKHHGYLDAYGNRCERMTLPPGDTVLRYDATVVVPDATEPADPGARELPVADLPDETLVYTLPSRFVLSDVLSDEAWSRFGSLAPGYGRVQAICDFVNGHLRFSYGTSTPTTTSADVFGAGVGVCRDFTHLGITFCRALNIPARLAVGYSIFDSPPPDFHAMFEAYIGGRWQLFDPTEMSSPEEMVRIAVGRDAKDVAFSTIFGAAQCRLIMPCIERG